MDSALNPALAYVAGALTILSPCVLPLVPIVLSSAAQRHRFAPVALAAGLVLAFTATGFVVAAFGQALGIDTLVVRNAGAIFCGPWSPASLGDYVAGPSHVLPTDGTARFSSA